MIGIAILVTVFRYASEITAPFSVIGRIVYVVPVNGIKYHVREGSQGNFRRAA